MNVKYFGLFALLASCTTQESFAPWDGGTAFPDERAVALPNAVVGFVTNSYSDSISLLDPQDLRALGTIGVGRDPVAIDGPHHLAVDRRGQNEGYVYLALSYPVDTSSQGPHAGHGSSTRLGWLQVLTFPSAAPVYETYIDENPGDIVLSADKTRLVVSHFNLTKALDPKLASADRIGRLFVFDTKDVQGTTGTTPKDPRKIPACRAPHGVVVDAAGHTAWVACYGEDALISVDLDAGTVGERLSFVATPSDTPTVGPYALVASHAFDAFAVGTTESSELRVVDRGVAGMTERFPAVRLQGAAYFPAWSVDDARIYVPTQKADAIAVVDAKTGALRGGRAFAANECVRPHEVRLAPNGTSLLVVCEGDHVTPGSVVALDRETLNFQQSIPVGVYPDRLVLEAP